MGAAHIKTDRLILRRWRDGDKAPFAAICADPEVMRHIGDGSPRTAEQSARAIDGFEQEWDRSGFGLFAVALRGTSELIGFTGLSRPDFLPEIYPSVEIGWRLARSRWGQGYATEAARAALSFGTDRLGLTDIVSTCQVENHASRRIMEKLGLRHDRRTLVPSCNRQVDVYRWTQPG